ncbi:hypothetical protein [Gluconacetobacter azotocaptans]|uniref:hypothetical protein n=1 Tax=Gluconacetobacter azotocaptans TaxID=142834 RepID=UPI0019588D69|nr:hypothetical protein [Gluconacetobacter azotocaptans]
MDLAEKYGPECNPTNTLPGAALHPAEISLILILRRLASTTSRPWKNFRKMQNP